VLAQVAEQYFKAAVLFREVFNAHLPAIGAGRCVDDQVMLVFGDVGHVVHVWSLIVAVDELIFTLRSAHCVVINHVVLIVSAKLFAFVWGGITVVKKAIAIPCG